MLWAIGLIGVFYLMTLVLGFGAAALLDTGAEQRGRRRAAATWRRRCSPRRSAAATGSTGGAILLAVIAAVAFATILAVVAGLTLTSASSVAHDLYANVIKKGTGDRAAARSWSPGSRRSCIGAIAILLAIPAQKLNIAFLVALAFAVAASANLPALLYNLFWKRFNTRGATWSIYGGLVSCVGPGGLLAGRVRQGAAGRQDGFPVPAGVDFHWFPLENPGIISIPLGFLFGWLGTITSKDPESEARVRRARGARP